MEPVSPSRTSHVIWHDVECGAYEADLALWTELAEAGGGPVLELGCGTGRVARHLASHGHEVVGLDRDPDLLRELERREQAQAGFVQGLLGDAREFALDRRFALVIGAMQLPQLLDPGERRSCLACVRRHLLPQGRAAFALVEELPAAEDSMPLPDVREVDGWVYSSLPVDTALVGDAIAVRRLRQVVSPAGELSEAEDEVRLLRLDAEGLEAEARSAGLRPLERRLLPPTREHVGSTVVILGRRP